MEITNDVETPIFPYIKTPILPEMAVTEITKEITESLEG
jgi:hypothetical protein